MAKRLTVHVEQDPPRTGLARVVDTVRSFFIGPVSTGTPDFERLFADPPSRSGVPVTPHSALTYSAFWACVNAIATDVGSLPLIHYKRDRDGGKTRYTDSKLYRLLHDEPNPEMTALTMRQTLTAHALSWGNGYAEIERDGALKPIAFWPITPNRVAPYRTTTGEVAYLVRRGDGGETPVPAADMIHLPGLGFDGIRGYSVVTMARESIGLGLGTERFGSTFFGNGSTFGGVISYPGARPTELAEKSYRESLNTQHQGIDRAHKLLALYNGATYSAKGVNPNDAQFLETRLHQIEEMCRWFRMPPHKIQHLLRATNNNIEHQAIEYVTDTLRPWLVRWEQEINRKCISASERRIQYVEHLIDGVLRGDLASRYAAYAVGRQWGWLSADDVRERENLNPLADKTGQIYLVPMNMTPANRIDELITAQIAAKKTPPVPPPQPGHPDLTTIHTNAMAMVEAIRAAVTEAQQRADAHLARAVQAEDTAATLTEADAGLRAEIERERAAALAAASEVGTLKALLLEATDREAVLRADVKAGNTRTARAQAKHAKATVHVTTAQAAAAEADRKRQESERNLDQALAQAVLAEARAASLDAESQRLTLAAAESLAARDAALALVATRDAALAEARVALTATDEARERLDAALAAREVCVAEDEARLHTLAELTEQLQAAHATVDARQADLATAQQALADAEARVTAEATARTAAEAASAAQHAAELQRMTAVIGAHRGLIADAMGRMIRRETEKARRAQATPEKLRTWIETFYPVHEDICRAALLPVLRAHLAWQQSTEDPAVVTQTIVRAHIAESIRQLRLVLDSDAEDLPVTLETTLRHWELERADAVADGILKEAIDHVSQTTP